MWPLLLLWSGAVLPQAWSQSDSDEAAREVKRLIRRGDRHFQRREMVEAAKVYEQAYSRDNTNFDLTYKLGRAKWYSEDVDLAIQYYNQARQIDPDGNDTLYFDLGNALKKVGSYDEAEIQFREFVKRQPADGIFTRQARYELEGIEEARQLMQDKPKWEFKSLPFNSENNDFSTALFNVEADSFLIFTSHRAPMKKGKVKKVKRLYPFTGEPYSDLYIVKVESDSIFGEPERLGKKRINTKANDGSPCIDPTGTILYYTICGEGRIGKKWGCQIYMSEYNNERKSWSKFKKVPDVNTTRKQMVNSRGKEKKVAVQDMQPCLSPDGQIMYFVSDREGGFGGKDLWFATKNGDKWSTPVNCGPKVNTEFDEIFPYIGADGKALYFSSNGRKGLGGFDMFRVEGEKTTWSEPENMGYPLNTSYNDYALVWIYQDSIGYLSSDRTPSIGRDDIFGIKKIYRPDYPITVHGYVRDRDTRQPIPFATVTLYRLENDGSITPLDTFLTQQNAYYEFPLENGFDYKLVATAPEYLSNQAFVSTSEVDASRGPVDLEQDIDIYLEGIQIDQPYILQNIYYDFDKSDLRPESKAELDKLIALLEANPTIIIQIGSHTDTNGTERYNIRLGDRRARSVVTYLKDSGIPLDRLEAFGYGESQPLIYPELSDSDEQANRRTEFRIRSFNYKPKKK
jgi:outer membrane protein OmpA-like peptidoglycan-associated protein